MKREVEVVETGLDELSLKRICACVWRLKKGHKIFGGKKTNPLRTILDPPPKITLIGSTQSPCSASVLHNERQKWHCPCYWSWVQSSYVLRRGPKLVCVTGHCLLLPVRECGTNITVFIGFIVSPLNSTESPVLAAVWWNYLTQLLTVVLNVSGINASRGWSWDSVRLRAVGLHWLELVMCFLGLRSQRGTHITNIAALCVRCPICWTTVRVATRLENP